VTIKVFFALHSFYFYVFTSLVDIHCTVQSFTLLKYETTWPEKHFDWWQHLPTVWKKNEIAECSCSK